MCPQYLCPRQDTIVELVAQFTKQCFGIRITRKSPVTLRIACQQNTGLLKQLSDGSAVEIQPAARQPQRCVRLLRRCAPAKGVRLRLVIVHDAARKCVTVAERIPGLALDHQDLGISRAFSHQNDGCRRPRFYRIRIVLLHAYENCENIRTQ